MKIFSTLAFSITLNLLAAQCPYKIKIDVLVWDGPKVTLKWHSDPKILRGGFDIFRTSLTLKNGLEKYIDSVAALKSLEYSDEDRALVRNHIYEYRVQMHDFPQCSVKKRTEGRAIEDDSLSGQPVKSLGLFTQKDVLNIKTKTLVAKLNTFFPIEIDIKDFKFPFTNQLTFALICGDKVIKTTSSVNGDDFRFANIFIPKNTGLTPQFRITVIQGNEILGSSALIQLHE
jgi:hypothetical protein